MAAEREPDLPTHTRHSGTHEAAQPLKGEPGIPECLARSETPMLRFRVRVRQGPAAPRNDEFVAGPALNAPKYFFPMSC